MCAKRVISGAGSRLWIGTQPDWESAATAYDRETIVDQCHLEREPWTGPAVRQDERLSRRLYVREACSVEACRWWYGLMYTVDPLVGFATTDSAGFGFATVGVHAPEAAEPVRLVSLWPEGITLSADLGATAMMEVVARCAREAPSGPIAGVGGDSPAAMAMPDSALTVASEPIPVVRAVLECGQRVTPLGYACGVDTGIRRPRVLGREWKLCLRIPARDMDLRGITDWQWRLVSSGVETRELVVTGTGSKLVSSHEQLIQDRVGVEATWVVETVTMEWS